MREASGDGRQLWLRVADGVCVIRYRSARSALDQWQVALTIGPRNARLLADRGRFAAGRVSAANEYARRAQSRIPGDPTVLSVLRDLGLTA